MKTICSYSPPGRSTRLVDERRLAQAPPFRLLAQGQLREILNQARARLLPVGAVVFDEGQPAEQCHLLLSGTVRFVRTTEDGDRIIVLYISAGEVFGIGAPLGAGLRQETAVTADGCLILTWPGTLWQHFADTYPGFATELMLSFGRRSNEMGNRIVELSTKQVEQRIACTLLRLVSQSGRKVDGGVEIGFPISRQNVAELTGATLHTVSRVLSKWEKLRLIESTRCHIVVTDPNRLILVSIDTARVPASVPTGSVAV